MNALKEHQSKKKKKIIGNFRRTYFRKGFSVFLQIKWKWFSTQFCDHFNNFKLYSPISKCLGHISYNVWVDKILDRVFVLTSKMCRVFLPCVQWRQLQNVTWIHILSWCSLMMYVCDVSVSYCEFDYRLYSFCVCLSFTFTNRYRQKKTNNTAKASAL